MQLLNLKKMINKSLPLHTKNILLQCACIADKNNLKIYLVGGIVRDLILGRKIFDIDITVQGNAIEFCKILEKSLNCEIVQTQENLKTAKVRFSENIDIDFASTRQEEYPRKGYLPTVIKTGCSLLEDIPRRDFSINSIAMSLNNENYGDIIDPTGGLNDLKNKNLRILHKKSFIDDPSRIIRGLKFSVRFGFELSQETKELQDQYLENPIRDLSTSRIKSELEQTFSLNKPEAFDICINQKLYKIFSDTSNSHIKGQEIFDLIQKYLSEIPFIWLIYFGCLIKEEKTIGFFSFEKQEKKIIIDALDMISNNIQTNDNFTIYKYFNNKQTSSILIYYLVTKNPAAILYLESLRKYKIETTGSDLIEMGFQPGNQFPEIFDKILIEKLSGKIKNKSEEIDFIKNIKNS